MGVVGEEGVNYRAEEENVLEMRTKAKAYL